jgi:dienelactone hydrolase
VVRAAMGLFSVVVGLLLVLRPFAGHGLLVAVIAIALIVGAVAEFTQGSSEAPARWALAASYALGAGVIILWPHASLPLIGAVVGLLLVATGAMELWSALLIHARRLPPLLIGVASGGFAVALVSGASAFVLGVVAVLWTDAALLPMSIALGLRLMVSGTGLLADLWYPPTGFGASTERFRFLWRCIALVVGVTVFLIGAVGDQSRQRPSEFYAREIPSGTAAGALLRADRDPSDQAAVRLLYATTDADGAAVVASALLYVPASTSSAEAPLVVWAHGETGIAQDCAPSLNNGTAVLAAVPQLLAAGYAVLAPDYVGLGTAGASSYLVGVVEAHAVLDAIRAATQVPGLKTGSAVLWGYSQGGHAALWAGQLANQYAPELKIAGVAVQAPLADPGAVLANLVARGAAGDIGSYLLATYAQRYPDVRLADYLSPAELLLAEEVAARCGDLSWADRGLEFATGANGSWSASPQTGALAVRLAENTPSGVIRVPVLVLQGADDLVVPVAVQDAVMAARCKAGQVVDYRVYPGVGHTGPAASGSAQFSELMTWTADRFAGLAAAHACH